jgi:hypothetical protein
MRAATAIVGAIAVASILIALAFILSGGGSSGQTAVTKTVVERVEAPAEGAGSQEGGAVESGGQFGGPTQCGKELSVENTTCEIGEQIHDDYVGGRRGDLFVKDRETGKTITMLCGEEAAPVTCTSEEGAVVYFEP